MIRFACLSPPGRAGYLDLDLAGFGAFRRLRRGVWAFAEKPAPDPLVDFDDDNRQNKGEQSHADKVVHFDGSDVQEFAKRREHRD